MAYQARRLILSSVLLSVMAIPLLAITGGPADITCPLCQEKNTFYVWFSYGSYIYQFPTKFQFVFWPLTDPYALYHCRKCHFTAFAGDFEKPPADKVESTKALLSSVAVSEDLTAQKYFAAASSKDGHQRMLYTKIPMAERLEIAERVYALWGKPDEWWCRFYRIKGFHLEKENKLEDAKAARLKALELAMKLASDPKRAGEKKEFLFVAGSMRYYTGDPNGALAEFRAATAIEYRHPEAKEENNKGFNEYVNEIIKEFIAAMQAGRRPDAERKEEPPRF